MSTPVRSASLRRRPTILLATDFGEPSAGATDYAIALSAALGGRLVVTNVIDPVTALGSTLGHRMDQVRELRERGASAVVAEARAAGADATFLVWTGDPGTAVLEAAEAEDADAIVMGSHRRDPLRRVLLGSVSDHVLHHARRPVVLVPPETTR
jgi:nucleotide-binding universal stress UspA family protein